MLSAVFKGDTAITELLLQHGASLETKDEFGPGSPVGGVTRDGEFCRVAPLATPSAWQVFRGEQRELNPDSDFTRALLDVDFTQHEPGE